MAGRLLSRLTFKRQILRQNGVKASQTQTSCIQSDVKNDTESPDRRETHFGFQTVSETEKEKKVHHVFESVASRYDLMNDVMSVGIHRVWKDTFIDRLAPVPGTKLIDVAGGTGDIAFRFLKYAQTLERGRKSKTNTDFSDEQVINIPLSESFNEKNLDNSAEGDGVYRGSHVTVCDINQAMLDEGKQKAEKLGLHEGVSWLLGNAEEIPVPDETYDAFTIAFGIRNCTHVDKVVSEAYRILKPGGRFMCLEFSHVHPLLKSFYDNYSFQVIPVMGQVIAGDWDSYQYLVESIRQFPNQEDFSTMIRDAGFSAVKYENLTFGVVAIHSGFKL